MTERERFEEAVGTLLRHEGGLSDDPIDRGGLTKYGITLGFLRSIGPDGDINGDGVVDDKDVRSLNVPKAKEIYYKHVWKRYRLGEIQSSVVATKCLELCVWMGYDDMATYLQEAICATYGGPVIQLDGIAGSKTLAALNNVVNPGMVLVALRSLALNHVRREVKNDPSQVRFINGWTRRALW